MADRTFVNIVDIVSFSAFASAGHIDRPQSCLAIPALLVILGLHH